MLRLTIICAVFVGCATSDTPSQDTASDGKADGTAPERSFATYSAIIKSTGAPVNPGGKASVLGLRGISLAGSVHDTVAAHRYDDTFAVLTPDHRVLELAGSTHPWEKASSAAQDADGDGTGDVGLLRPGEYSALARSPGQDILGQPTYHVTAAGSDRVPGWRDTDHDGVISDGEREASELRRDTLGAILFHSEGTGAPAAIGCQVFSVDTIKRLVAQLGGRVSFDYVLTDVHDLDPSLLSY